MNRNLPVVAKQQATFDGAKAFIKMGHRACVKIVHHPDERLVGHVCITTPVKLIHWGEDGKAKQFETENTIYTLV